MDDSVRVDERVFPNGDVYTGDFKGVLPHGKGRYTWSDGSVYEGEWENGKMTGKGIVVWSSGAKYEGDVSGGYLHGCGTLTGIDGSVYTGSWRMNVRHGVGKKEYANSDIYEGMWKEGVPEGNGSYSWSNGNIYVGKFKGGKMCGRGIMRWVNGDLYSGSWLNGSIHGSGLYRFADGSYYFGWWTRGLKDGKGTYYPVGVKQPSLRKWCSLTFEDDGKSLSSRGSSFALEDFRAAGSSISRSLSEHIPMDGFSLNSGGVTHRAAPSDDNSVVFNSDREFTHQNSSCAHRVTGIGNENKQENEDGNSVVFEREYMQGVLIKEKIRKYAELLHKSDRKKKLHENELHMRADENISTNQRSYNLMLNLQLGIRYTVGKITPVHAREVRPSDFGDHARIRMYFPRKGSQFTPPHNSVDFYWKDYCPMVFRNLREMFKLDAAEFMMSICGDDGLKELSSPGKSGSIFYYSQDGKFIIKTLKKYELKVLLKMLQNYYNHVKMHENTLITKFFGVHRIKLKGGRKVRFVVMGNMFCTELRIHRRYDLKGSSQGRYTDKDKINEDTTLKDLDLAYEFQMDKLLRGSLFEQLALDSRFLESQQIIDYSLLLGLHFRAPEPLKAHIHPPDTRHSGSNGVNSQGELLTPPKGLILVTHEPSVSTTPGPHIRGKTLRAFSVGDKEVDLLLPGTGRLRVQLGVNMPAQANRKVMQDETDSREIELFETYDVVLYMGIIDILQEYNLKKKVEHAYKSLKFDPLKISVVEPKLYAKRFIDFLESVFTSPNQ